MRAHLRLIQFCAGYNVVVHAAIEHGLFARHGLRVEVEHTPGSLYLSEALRVGKFHIGHTGADDVIADVETSGGASDLFLFMGLHSGLLSLVSAPRIRDIESLRGEALAVDARASGFVFILEKTLRAAGVAEGDYQLVEVGGWESRYRALVEGKCAATLLTPPYIGQALGVGCRLLARGDAMMPVYQATGGAASRAWARRNGEALVNYIRAYVEATQWCFNPKNRKACVKLLTKHNGITKAAASETLDQLLDLEYGLYPKAELNIPGIAAALELRAEMGHLGRPLPAVEKYVDLSYYRKAMVERES
ncbi:MAG: ABC transporter substrate-binding protein [Deltaproteobacteria bacterium]|nr:ABC transporter substrate-binding protein [Deltaproteobacteria bacterium]